MRISFFLDTLYFRALCTSAKPHPVNVGNPEFVLTKACYKRALAKAKQGSAETLKRDEAHSSASNSSRTRKRSAAATAQSRNGSCAVSPFIHDGRAVHCRGVIPWKCAVLCEEKLFSPHPLDHLELVEPND